MIKVARNGVEIGRFTPEELLKRIQAKDVLLTDDYWQEGMQGWQKVASLSSPVGAGNTSPKPPFMDQIKASDRSLAANQKPLVTLARLIRHPTQLGLLWLTSRILIEAHYAATVYAEARGPMFTLATRAEGGLSGMKSIIPTYWIYGKEVAALLIVAAVLLLPTLRLVQDLGKPEAKKPWEYWTRFFG